MALEGITVLELGGLAPSQFTCKVLQDFGAKIIKIDKTNNSADYTEILNYGKLSVALNLKTAKGCDILKQLCRKADVLVESFRDGVMEKLGLGPEELMRENRSLVYTRLTSFGKDNVYAGKGGHDLNFLALSGFLTLTNAEHQIPLVSTNSDFAGSGIIASNGILLALLERERSGLGQVVEVSLLRSVSYLMSWIMDAKDIVLEPVSDKDNLFGGGLYVYNTYKTKDGKKMAVASVEPQLYDQLLVGLELSHEECPYFCNNGQDILAKKFLEKTQSEWIEIFKDLDACVTPVLRMDEVVRDRPHDFVKSDKGNLLPVPEPRLCRSLPSTSKLLASPSRGQHTLPVLQALGYTYQQICQFASEGIVYFPNASKL